MASGVKEVIKRKRASALELLLKDNIGKEPSSSRRREDLRNIGVESTENLNKVDIRLEDLKYPGNVFVKKRSSSSSASKSIKFESAKSTDCSNSTGKDVDAFNLPDLLIDNNETKRESYDNITEELKQFNIDFKEKFETKFKIENLNTELEVETDQDDRDNGLNDNIFEEDEIDDNDQDNNNQSNNEQNDNDQNDNNQDDNNQDENDQDENDQDENDQDENDQDENDQEQNLEMAEVKTFATLLQLSATYVANEAQRATVIAQIVDDQLEAFLTMVTETADIDPEFKIEIQDRLRNIRQTKNINALTIQLNGMRSNFDDFLGTMSKNPFKERNISYGGYREKDESYIRFKKDVEQIMREDIIYKNMTADEKDMAMGEQVKTGTYGAAKNLIGNYHDDCIKKNSRYKWSELEPKLAKVFGNKNEVFDLTNKLATIKSSDFENIVVFNQRFLELLQLIPNGIFNENSIRLYYFQALENRVKTKIRSKNTDDTMTLDSMMEIASNDEPQKVSKFSNYMSKNINMPNKSKGYAPTAPSNASAPPGPKCFKCGE